MMLSNHLILCHPLLLLPSVFPSIRIFSSALALCIRWPKYWSLSFSISPSNRVDFFRIDWFDLAVQGTLKSLLQHYNSKALILQCSTFFMVQLSHLYMTPGKTLTLTIWTFVDKVISLLFNMLSRFILAFLPKNKHLLISRLQSPSTLILEPKKTKSVTASTFSLFAVRWWDQMWCPKSVWRHLSWSVWFMQYFLNSSFLYFFILVVNITLFS